VLSVPMHRGCKNSTKIKKHAYEIGINFGNTSGAKY
jgi:hypothetical protein